MTSIMRKVVIVTGVVCILIGILLGRMSVSPQTNGLITPPSSKPISLESREQTDLSLNAESQQAPSLKETTLVTRVVDGDTIEIQGGTRVRLIGIDTPEVGDCYAAEATNYLRSLIDGKTVVLEKDVSETDRYGRLLRYIWMDDVLVNDELVQEGFAHSSTFPPDVKYQERFLAAERESRKAGRGLWSECIDIKGTTTSQSTPQPSKTIDTDACTIKGNVSSSGEKIYHLPGQRYYEKTQIDESKGEKWFCSEEEALNAGWRKSKV